MSGTIDRRALMLAAAAGAAAPVLAHAEARAPVSGYFERLRGRIDDAGGGRFIAATEDALLGEHNQFRASNGQHALKRQPALDEAARAHVADMIERGYFQHASPEGFTSTERVGLLARRFVGLAGENIVEVMGGPPSTAAELATLWRDSPGHRANMLRATYTHVGFGVARRGDRTVAGAVFGQSFAELSQPLAFRIDSVGAVAQLLGRAAPTVSGYALEPVGGGRQHGPFWVEDPAPRLALAGAFVVKPYLPDPTTPRRFIIVDGPIVEGEG